MSNVHEAISNHSKKQHQHIQTFLMLEAKREAYIEEAVQLCKSSLSFDVARINNVTLEINHLASKGITPTRKLVTNEMVRDFVIKKYQR